MPAMAKAASPDVRCAVRTVKAGSVRFRCKVVTLDLAAGRVAPRLITAVGGIGRTEDFASMIRRSKAVVAINGSFFAAYNPAGDQDPDMTLIRNGQVIHTGMIGTVLGFGARGVVMGRLDLLPIRGTVKQPDGRIATWYADWLNRAPRSAACITIFTPARGERARVSDGLCIVVNNDVVTRIVQGDAAIPPTGYVIHFRGGRLREAQKFREGAEVGWNIAFHADRDQNAWLAVGEAVGAGPRLVRDGEIAVDPLSEGFQDPKILDDRAMRSAIGITKTGKLLLVTAAGPAIGELAVLMRSLGAVQAMNLDGGGSSGLYCNGQILTRPGRPLSNALVFVRP
jgi:hypothetical protein